MPIETPRTPRHTQKLVKTERPLWTVDKDAEQRGDSLAPSGKASKRPPGGTGRRHQKQRHPHKVRDPRIPSRGEPWKKRRHQERQKNVYSSTVHDSTRLEKYQLSMDSRMKKAPNDVYENDRTACVISDMTLDLHFEGESQQGSDLSPGLKRLGNDKCTRNNSVRTPGRPIAKGQGPGGSPGPSQLTASSAPGHRRGGGAHAEASAVPEPRTLTGSLGAPSLPDVADQVPGPRLPHTRTTLRTVRGPPGVFGRVMTSSVREEPPQRIRASSIQQSRRAKDGAVPTRHTQNKKMGINSCLPSPQAKRRSLSMA